MPTVPRNPKRPGRSAPLRTHAEVRAWFEDQGLSIAAWARGHGVAPSLVYDILAARDIRRCLRGDSHRVAVLLGLKRGRIQSSAAASARRARQALPTS